MFSNKHLYPEACNHKFVVDSTKNMRERNWYFELKDVDLLKNYNYFFYYFKSNDVSTF